MTEKNNSTKYSKDLFRAIVGVAVAFAVLLAAKLLLFREPAPVLAAVTWFIPAISLFQALTLFSVGFLALGRYHVLRDLPSFWIGMGTTGFGTALVFYALTWPGLLPDGGPVIASLPGTPAWFVQLGITVFSTFLLAAVLSRRPRGGKPAGGHLPALMTAWIVFLAVAFTLVVHAEQYLPVLVTATGVFAMPLLVWNAAVAVLFAAGAALSTRRYLQTGNALLGYIVFAQMGFAFAIFITVGGMTRYDLWWYLLRVILTGSSLIVLFGLLYEYVQLYRRERERTAQLLEAENELIVARDEAERNYLQLHAIIENMGEGVVAADARGDIFLINRAMLAIAGLEDAPKEHLSRYVGRTEIRDVDGRKVSPEQWPVARALRGESVRDVEFFVRRLDTGKCYTALYNAAPVPDKDGRILMAIGIVRDITSRKKAEEKVRKLNEELEGKVRERTHVLARTVERLESQREVLQTVIDNIPVMLVLYDAQGNIKLVNREFQRLLGWSLKEARNMDLMASVYPDPHYRREVWEYMKEAQPAWKDFEVTTRSGSIFSSSWTNVRLSDGAQIGIGIDVSERRRMEQDMERLAKAVGQAGEGIVVFDREWNIEYINPAYENLTGYTRDELVGRRITSLTGYLDENDYKEIIEYVTEHGKEWIGRQKRTRKTGEVFDVSLTVTPVYTQEGAVTSYISVVRDITGEVRLQEQLAQNQKLESIGTLAGGIAHDLKNILTPIVINSEIALMDVAEDHPVHEMLEEIKQAARMGTDVVNQIVTFSRRNILEKKPVAIEPVVKEAVDFLRTALPSTIDIRQKLSGQGSLVMADATRIKQVMINLGINAGHAMKDRGGLLEVKLTREWLSEDEAGSLSPDLPAGPYVLIMVRDSGVGMDEQTMQRIFEPFFTTKKHGEGTGMGLAVVHGIVKDHKGAVTVWSRPGRGSSFCILLPVLKNESEKNSAVSC